MNSSDIEIHRSSSRRRKATQDTKTFVETAGSTRLLINALVKRITSGEDEQEQEAREERPEERKLLENRLTRRSTISYGTQTSRVAPRRTNSTSLREKPSGLKRVSLRSSQQQSSYRQIDDKSSKWMENLTSSIKRSISAMSQQGAEMGSTGPGKLGLSGRQRSTRSQYHQSGWLNKTRKASLSISQLFIVCSLLAVSLVAMGASIASRDHIEPYWWRPEIFKTNEWSQEGPNQGEFDGEPVSDADIELQRRRLNRDRALEPAPWLREQPMRRGSTPPIEGELSTDQEAKPRMSRQTSDDIYSELLRQIIFGLLDGQASEVDVTQQPKQSDDSSMITNYETPPNPSGSRMAKLVLESADLSPESLAGVVAGDVIDEPEATFRVSDAANIEKANEPVSGIPNGADVMQLAPNGESFHVVEDIDRDTFDDHQRGQRESQAHNQGGLYEQSSKDLAWNRMVPSGRPMLLSKRHMSAWKDELDQVNPRSSLPFGNDRLRWFPMVLDNFQAPGASEVRQNVSRLGANLPLEDSFIEAFPINEEIFALFGSTGSIPDQWTTNGNAKTNSERLPNGWLNSNKDRSRIKIDNSPEPRRIIWDLATSSQGPTTRKTTRLNYKLSDSSNGAQNSIGLDEDQLAAIDYLGAQEDEIDPDSRKVLLDLGQPVRILGTSKLLLDPIPYPTKVSVSSPPAPPVDPSAYLEQILEANNRRIVSIADSETEPHFLSHPIQRIQAMRARIKGADISSKSRENYWFHVAAIVAALAGALVTLKLIIRNSGGQNLDSSQETTTGFFRRRPFSGLCSNSSSTFSTVFGRSAEDSKNLEGANYDPSVSIENKQPKGQEAEIERQRSDAIKGLTHRLSALLKHQWPQKAQADTTVTEEDEKPLGLEGNQNRESEVKEDEEKLVKGIGSSYEPYRSSRSYIKSLVEALAKARSQIPNQFIMSSSKRRILDEEDEEDRDEKEALIKGDKFESKDTLRVSNCSPLEDLKDSESANLVSQMDISAAHLILSYMEKHLEDKERLRREWLELNLGQPHISTSSLKLTSNDNDNKFGRLMLERMARVALCKENRAKNRNNQIVPFDRNRVKLGTSGSPGAPRKGNQRDYINASLIYDDDPRRATHIIAQGPLESTVAQFWQMIWEQGISVIVMLTRLNENGVKMSHCYWPTDSVGQGQQVNAQSSQTVEAQGDGASTSTANGRRGSVTSVFSANGSGRNGQPIIANGNLSNNVIYFEVPLGYSEKRASNGSDVNKFEVHLVSEHVSSSDYLVRNMYMINRSTGETRTITQFHYLAWPKSSVPENVKSLLQFRRKVHKSYRDAKSPILVHSSDGAGRSGTYTLIDIILQRIQNGAKEIDPRATLEHLRDQRVGVCATQKQFEFVLVALAEEIQLIIDSLPQ